MNFDNIVLTVSSLLFEKIFHSKCHVNIRRNQLICQSAGATVPILATTKKKKKKKKKIASLAFLKFFYSLLLLCYFLFFDKIYNNQNQKVRSSLWRCFVRKSVTKNFGNFKENHLCWSLFLVRLQAFRPTV